MIKLLSTDFDGTLVDHFTVPPVSPELFDLFRELRSRGVMWSVNTGRELHHIEDGLREFARAKSITRQRFPLPVDLSSFTRPATAFDAVAQKVTDDTGHAVWHGTPNGRR